LDIAVVENMVLPPKPNVRGVSAVNKNIYWSKFFS
jgi:hypothetical protein